MSEIPANGQPDEPFVPKIVPPEGQRTARGQFSNDDENEHENENAEVTTENGGDFDAATDFEVEDSYFPPPDYEIEPDPPSLEEPGFLSGKARPDTPKDKEIGLLEHLNELRVRLLYCALILVAGMTLTWNYSQPLQAWFASPIMAVIKGKGTLQQLDPTGFFSITFQFSMVSALILTAPFLFWQVWRFIEPALTHSERRYSLVGVPFSSALFFTGAALGYEVSPLFFKFFLAFQPPGVAANWDYGQSILLMAKMLLVFGITFQVPVIVIFLNKLGILSRNVLIEYWRHAVVVIFTVVAIITPTWDPVTLVVCATPPCLLYVLSIWLVKWL